MSIMNCDFCARSVDTDFEPLEPMCDHSKSICEGCYTDALNHVEATLNQFDIMAFRRAADDPDDMELLMSFLVPKVDGHETTESLNWLDLEGLIVEVAS